MYRKSKPFKALCQLLCVTLLITILCISGTGNVEAATEWAPGINYATGTQVTYQGSLYQCIIAHTSMTGWEPPVVPTLWKFISSGTSTPTPPPPTPTPTPPPPTPTPTPPPPTPTPTPTPTPPPPTPTPPPAQVRTDELSVTFTLTSETATNYSGKITIKNPNTSYAWNGKLFDLLDLSFVTTSQITSASINDGSVIITSADGRIHFNIGWLSMFPLGKTQEITIQATKSGSTVFPQDFRPHYVRSETIRYPQYEGLPSSWYKGKATVTTADLIANSAEYYSTATAPVNDKVVIYNPYHKTQIWIGQPVSVTTRINETPNIRVWVPSRYMAMGLGFNYEFFKFNPNFIVALGTKENFACGIVHESSNISTGYRVTVDGQIYYWPFLAMPDGPFQQEAQNFNDVKANMPDFLADNAMHPDFCQTSTSQDDPAFVNSTITCGLSLVVTREHLNAVKGVNYNEFMQQARDPWAEFVILDYAYNMGAPEIFKERIFGSRRLEAINATSMDQVLGLVGDSGHVQEVKGLLNEINNETNYIYNAKITWQDMENYFTRVRKFYSQGVPTEAEWTAMKADVRKAFNVLSAHWGDNTISFRYDFLTLLRVMKAYLPQSSLPATYVPRPTGENWYYIITNQPVN